MQCRSIWQVQAILRKPLAKPWMRQFEYSSRQQPLTARWTKSWKTPDTGANQRHGAARPGLASSNAWLKFRCQDLRRNIGANWRRFLWLPGFVLIGRRAVIGPM